LAEGACEVDAIRQRGVPGADLSDARRSQLHNVQHKVRAEALVIELNHIGQALHLDDLHVVDQTEAVLPGALAIAADRMDVNLLGGVQVVQRLGEQMHCIVHESRFGSHGGQIGGSQQTLLVDAPLAHHVRYDLLVDQPESGDIGPTVPELIQVDCVQIQRGDQVAVIVAHHANLLRLLQHLVDALRGTVEHNVRLRRVFDLLQQGTVRVSKNSELKFIVRILI